jgi:hypothetical protein
MLLGCSKVAVLLLRRGSAVELPSSDSVTVNAGPLIGGLVAAVTTAHGFHARLSSLTITPSSPCCDKVMSVTVTRSLDDV